MKVKILSGSDIRYVAYFEIRRFIHANIECFGGRVMFSRGMCIFCCIYVGEPSDIFGCELGLSSSRCGHVTKSRRFSSFRIRMILGLLINFLSAHIV